MKNNERSLNIERISKGAFVNLINLTTRAIIFDNNTKLKPSGTLASIKWVDEETVVGGLLLLKRDSVLSEEHILDLDALLGDDMLGIVSMHFVRQARGTILEGRVVSNIFVTQGSGISHNSKFAI